MIHPVRRRRLLPLPPRQAPHPRRPSSFLELDEMYHRIDDDLAEF